MFYLPTNHLFTQDVASLIRRATHSAIMLKMMSKIANQGVKKLLLGVEWVAVVVRQDKREGEGAIPAHIRTL